MDDDVAALWDETTRPTLDEAAGASYSPAQEAYHRHLVEIHDHLRSELTRLHDLVEEVRRGVLTAVEARSEVHAMSLRQNNWTLGAYCQSYCGFVNGHHTLEDASVFPHLRRSDEGLGPVIDRLEEEHEQIADLLERVDSALVALVAAEEDGIGGVGRAMDLLTDALLSHFSYEERELVEPLARHGFY